MAVENHKISLPKLLLFSGVIFVLCFVGVIFLFVRNYRDSAINTLAITFLDIGQGDATLVQFPEGKTMLVDCAKNAIVLSALSRQLPFWQREIDYLVVTHPDSDHYGGCIDVLDRYRVKEIILNGFEKNDSFYHSFVSAVERESAKIHIVETPFQWFIGGVTTTFLYPVRSIHDNPQVPGVSGEADSNNTSIVLKLSFGENDVLLTGDAEKEEELFLIDKYGKDLDVEVLKAGHHGSPSSSVEPFVSSTSPVHVIFSAGKGNSYGHPSERVVRRFMRAGSRAWRTDTDGDIHMQVFRDSIKVETQNK